MQTNKETVRRKRKRSEKRKLVEKILDSLNSLIVTCASERTSMSTDATRTGCQLRAISSFVSIACWMDLRKTLFWQCRRKTLGNVHTIETHACADIVSIKRKISKFLWSKILMRYRDCLENNRLRKRKRMIQLRIQKTLLKRERKWNWKSRN